MSYRSISSNYEFSYTPEQIWEFLINPETTHKFQKNLCYYVEINSTLKGEKGESWTEIHNGESCTGDVVVQKIEAIEKYKFLKFAGVQTGIKQTITQTLTPTAEGCEMKEKIVFSPAFSGKFGMTLLSWLMLATGLLARFAKDPEADLHWYQKLEEALGAKHGKD